MAQNKGELMCLPLIFIGVLLLSRKSVASKDFKLKVIQVNGVLNDSATLHCTYNVKSAHIYAIIWRIASPRPEHTILYEYWNTDGQVKAQAFHNTALITVSGSFRPWLRYHELQIRHPTHAAEVRYHCEMWGWLEKEEIYEMAVLKLHLTVPPRSLPSILAKESGEHGKLCSQSPSKIVHVRNEWIVLVCHAYPSKPRGLISWSKGKLVNTTHVKQGKDGKMVHVWSTVNITRDKVGVEDVRCTIEGPNLHGHIEQTPVCITLDWKAGFSVERPIKDNKEDDKDNSGYLNPRLSVLFIIVGIILAGIIWGLVTCFNKYHWQKITRHKNTFMVTLEFKCCKSPCKSGSYEEGETEIDLNT